MRVQREKILNERKGNNRERTVEMYKLEESDEEVTVLVGVGSLEEAGGQLQE